ncbi:MAG: amino acid permease-associated region [Acidimicrobiaceae bacterium]|nr:amino acid permease-associated region [Acidimicrobiaceae bacterium]
MEVGERTPVRAAGDGPIEVRREKGLKSGALGLVSSVVVGVASTAPAYSLAATVGFVIAGVGLQTPIVAILAFVPILLVSFGYKELNRADPDCGTTFTWTTRAFGPKTGWWNGWAIVAADVLVMASLAQIAGQYLFLLFNNHSIGNNPSSGWVLLVGIAWIVTMTYICYRGIELSANIQKALLGIELTMLLVLSVVALVKVGNGTAPLGHLVPSASWFNPFDVASFSTFVQGLLLMLFIYWGWDTAVSVNEETADKERTPGRAAVLSTLVLLATYALVIISIQSFAGLGTKGVGLGNSANINDVLSPLGHAVFGTSGFGNVLAHLLLLMVLSSAAASTQTTILPTARTTLSMASYGALPPPFAKMHRRFLTPTVSTLVMGAVSIGLYVVLNYISAGSVIADSVTAIGIWIAFYYGFAGFACFWYYRKNLRSSARNLWMQGILPLTGGIILFAIMAWSLRLDWSPGFGYTHWKISSGLDVGGVFLIVLASFVVGLVLFLILLPNLRPFFRGETLNRATETLVPEDSGVPVAVGGPPESR